mgnify:CR=1 FL=1
MKINNKLNQQSLEAHMHKIYDFLLNKFIFELLNSKLK